MKQLLLFLLLLQLEVDAQPDSLKCDVLEIPSRAKRSVAASTPYPAGYTKTVLIYIETDNDIYNYCNHDTAQVRVFVNGWFEQWRQLYLRDSILIRIDSIGYWKTVEPYSWTSQSQNLIDFGTRMQATQPTADICHFVTIKNNGWGGMSYVGGLGQAKQWAVSCSHIYVAYYPVPSYSWTVEVMAHETGHMLGSQHTHNCYWNLPNGTVGPIDSCYNCEGGCCVQTPTIPGTIMSYCHLTSFGIDFNKGFGPLPKAVIKQLIWDCYNNGFLKNPNAGTCLTPYVTLISPTVNSAYVEWSKTGVQYKYRIKPAGQLWGAQITTVLTNANFTGLQSQKVHYIQIKSKCNGVWTSFSPSYKFKTK